MTYLVVSLACSFTLCVLLAFAGIVSGVWLFGVIAAEMIDGDTQDERRSEGERQASQGSKAETRDHQVPMAQVVSVMGQGFGCESLLRRAISHTPKLQ